MLSKSKIKFINSLKMGKYRKQHKMFFAEGSINVLDFIRNTGLTVEIFAGSEWIENHSVDISSLTTNEVSEKEMAKITALKSPSEVLAVFKMPEIDLPDFDPNTSGLVLLLDDIKDPGNMGTIIRTADWFGVKNIVCSTPTVDAFNPKVVQATMGSLARVNVSYRNLSTWLETVKGANIYGAVLDGEDVSVIDKPSSSILIIGSEAHGISIEVLRFVNFPLTIPRSSVGGAESLNAAVATSIILYSFSV